MTTLTVSEARAALPRIIESVTAGEEVALTRHGKVVAIVVRPDALRSRRAEGALAVADQIDEVLARGRAARLDPVPGVSPERAEDLVADVRTGRSAR